MSDYIPGAPGEPVVYVGPRLLLALADDTHELVARLARQGSLSADEAINEVSGENAPGEFVCLSADGNDLRVLVRGSFRVRGRGWVIEGADGAGGADGADDVVATAERLVPVDGAVRVEHGAAVVGGPERGWLSVRDGVVLSSVVDWQPAKSTDPRSETVRRSDVRRPSTSPDPVKPPAPPARRLLVSAPPPGPPPGPPAPSPIERTDHDGLTIAVGRPQSPPPPPPESSATAMTSPPPPPPPPPGRPGGRARIVLAVSGCDEVTVDRAVLVGRAPRATQVSSADLPLMVVVDDPYVSSTHLEVGRDGDSVVVIDRSSNGTLLTHPGAATVKLGPGVPTPVRDGAVLSLSDDVTARIVVTSEGGF